MASPWCMTNPVFFSYEKAHSTEVGHCLCMYPHLASPPEKWVSSTYSLSEWKKLAGCWYEKHVQGWLSCNFLIHKCVLSGKKGKHGSTVSYGDPSQSRHWTYSGLDQAFLKNYYFTVFNFFVLDSLQSQRAEFHTCAEPDLGTLPEHSAPSLNEEITCTPNALRARKTFLLFLFSHCLNSIDGTRLKQNSVFSSWTLKIIFILSDF